MTRKKFLARRKKMRERLSWRINGELAALTGVHVWFIDDWQVCAVVDLTVPF